MCNDINITFDDEERFMHVMCLAVPNLMPGCS